MAQSTKLAALADKRRKWCVEISNILSKGAGGSDDVSIEDVERATVIKNAHDATDAEFLSLQNVDNMRRFASSSLADDLEPQNLRRSVAPGSTLPSEPFQWKALNGTMRTMTRQPDGYLNTPEYSEMFNANLRKPVALHAEMESITNRLAKPERFSDVKNLMMTDDLTRGGYFMLPEEQLAGLLKTVDNEVFIQGLSRVIPMGKAESLGVRSRTAKSGWCGPISEIGNATKLLETQLKWGKRVIKPNEFAQFFLLSEELLENAETDVWGLYQEEIMIGFREFLETKYVSGSGVGEPLGLFTVDAANGIGADRDVATLATDLTSFQTAAGATAQSTFGFKTLLRTYFNLNPAYRANAKWMFHSTFMMNLATLTDDSGRIIWQPSAREGEPDRLLGKGVYESLWLPDTAGADLYSGIFADFKHYWITWRKQMRMRRFSELFGLNRMVGFMMVFEMDAQPIMSEAFRRLKFASA